MKSELPDGKILEPDAYRNLHMLEEFEIRNPSEYLHFEVLDVERTKEETRTSSSSPRLMVITTAVENDTKKKPPKKRLRRE